MAGGCLPPRIVSRCGVPLGRVGEAEEVTSVILFLASKQASYVSGSTIETAGALGKAL